MRISRDRSGKIVALSEDTGLQRWRLEMVAIFRRAWIWAGPRLIKTFRRRRVRFPRRIYSRNASVSANSTGRSSSSPSTPRMS